MNWQVVLLLSILFSSTRGLFHRTVMKKDDSSPYAQTVIYGILVGIFSLLIALFGGFHAPGLNLLPNFFLVLILLTLAPLLTFKGYQLVEAGQVSILMSTQVLWTVVLSFIFLHESVIFLKIIGILLILIGMTLVNFRGQKLEFGKGQLYILGAALLYGISYVNAFYILRNLDAPSFEVYASLLPAMALLLFRPKVIYKMGFYKRTSNWLSVLLAALFDTLATLALYFAYQLGGNASQIAPLSATSVVLTVILAAVFLQERQYLVNKTLGAMVAVWGIILTI